MKKALLLLLAVTASVTTMTARAQTTTVTASHIQNLSGQLLSFGYFELTPVNASLRPTAFTACGGGQVLPITYYWPIVNGALSGVAVPDTSCTTPSGVGYLVVIADQNKLPIYQYPQPIQPTGASWSFDAWSPSVSAQATPAGAILYGTQAPTNPCTAPSIYYYSSGGTQTAMLCVGATWTSLTPGGGAVSSVFGRSGAVVAATGDYTAAQVTGAATSGANSNITSLSGLTTPLSIAQGGNGTNAPGIVAGAGVAVAGSWPTQTIAAAVPSVFGRSGAVVAATGDYTAAQVTNAAATNAANTFTQPQQFSLVLTNVEYSLGTCTTALALTPANGNHQKVTLTAGDTCAITFTQPSSGTATVILKVISPASGVGQVTGGYWASGSGFTTTPPTLAETAGVWAFATCYLDGTNANCELSQ